MFRTQQRFRVHCVFSGVGICHERGAAGVCGTPLGQCDKKQLRFDSIQSRSVRQIFTKYNHGDLDFPGSDLRICMDYYVSRYRCLETRNLYCESIDRFSLSLTCTILHNCGQYCTGI